MRPQIQDGGRPPTGEIKNSPNILNRFTILTNIGMVMHLGSPHPIVRYNFWNLNIQDGERLPF